MADSTESSTCSLDEFDLKISENSEKHFVPLVEDVSEWLSQTFQKDINVENFLDELDNGSLMCQLAKRIQSTSEDYCVRRVGVKKASNYKSTPLPRFEYKIHENARKQSFQARENAANLISWCKDIGIDDSTLFESEGLVSHRQLRSITLTLLALGKIGEKYDLKPIPRLIALEKEIAEEEVTTPAKSMPNKSTTVSNERLEKGDTIENVDKEVQKLAGKYHIKARIVSEGKYILNEKQTILVRRLRRYIMVRVGGGWDELEHFLSRHNPEKIGKVLFYNLSFPHDNDDSFMMADSQSRRNLAVDRIDSDIFEKSEQNLTPLVEDVSEWLSQTFEKEITVENYINEIDDGSLLCQLAKKIQTTSEDYCLKRRGVAVSRDEDAPLPKFKYKIHENAREQSFQARENAANFISWCKDIGIDDSTLFESEGLVSHRQLKSVTLTLLALGKIGEKYDLKPIPRLIALEKKIAEEEGDCTTEPGDSTQADNWEGRNPSDAIDGEVQRIAAKCHVNVRKVSDGKYILNDKQTILLKPLRRYVMVRVGGGWDELEHFLSKHNPEKVGRVLLSFSNYDLMQKNSNN